MLHIPKFLLRIVLIFALLFISTPSFSQAGAKWATGGNAISNGDFIGTTNGTYSLNFKTNNVQRMSISPTGAFQVNNLSGTGNGLLIANSTGTFARLNFPMDTNLVLLGNGTFGSRSTGGNWLLDGDDLYNTNVGDVFVSGTIHAMGLVLATKMEADTVKGASMISVNNNLNLSGGTLNEMYTNTGDLRIQSRASYVGNNTIINAGNSGNVGIGVYSPIFKCDISGDARVSGKAYIYRILPLPGDSIVRFGDSTITLNTSANLISSTPLYSARGIGMGFNSTRAIGNGSIALGTKVRTSLSASYSVVIGLGDINNTYDFYNGIPYSLMVGFNSNRPTFFVGPSNGAGTTGRVGVGTSNPQSDFQVGETYQRVSIGGAPNVGTTISASYVGFNISRNAVNQWITGNDNANSGATLLLSDIGGGLRIIGIPTNGAVDQNLNDQYVQDHTRLFVRQDGRVIIGSETMIGGPHDSPTTLLTVDGTTVVRELFVTQNNWADSIFASGYNLISLDSVQAFLNINGHLPGVPSEKDIQENGSNLGQNDVILLAKIEELTLYILQQQKQIDQLNRKMNGQK